MKIASTYQLIVGQWHFINIIPNIIIQLYLSLNLIISILKAILQIKIISLQIRQNNKNTANKYSN